LYFTGKKFARSVLEPRRYVPSAKYLIVTMSIVASALKVTGLLAAVPTGLTHAMAAVPARVRDGASGAVSCPPPPPSHAARSELAVSAAATAS
jgi:hypothetical protein